MTLPLDGAIVGSLVGLLVGTVQLKRLRREDQVGLRFCALTVFLHAVPAERRGTPRKSHACGVEVTRHTEETVGHKFRKTSF